VSILNLRESKLKYSTDNDAGFTLSLTKVTDAFVLNDLAPLWSEAGTSFAFAKIKALRKIC
jgi:hypothetical protein